MTGSCNLASLSLQERQEMQADLIACRIRWQCKALKGREKQVAGSKALSALPLPMQELVVARLKARSGKS